MKKIYMIHILVCCLVFVFPSRASALFEFDYDVRGSFSTSYDDNVTFSKSNKKADVINEFVVGIGLEQEGKTHNLQIEGNITQQIFANNSSFNNTAQDVMVDFQKEITKFDRIHFSNTFLHAESPRSFDDEFGETTGRFSYYKNKFKTEYMREIASDKLLKTWYGNDVYEATRADLKDWQLHNAGLGMDFIKNSTTTWSLIYDFISKNLDPGAQATMHKLASGVKYFFKKTLSMEIVAGVLLIDTYDNKNLTKPSVKITLSNKLSDTTKMNLSYKKEHYPRGSKEDFFNSWRITANFTQRLFKRLAFMITGFYGEGDFISTNIGDKFKGIKTKLIYDVRENTKAFIGYSLSKVDSSSDSRDYNKNVVELGITFNF